MNTLIIILYLNRSDRDRPDSPDSDDERYIQYRESFLEVMNEIED